MACITTASMNVLWNGEVTDDFTPTRCIRQGDPISPYLFVLCIEWLSHGIRKAIMMEIESLCASPAVEPPLPTFFFFTDDLLLLAEASAI